MNALVGLAISGLAFALSTTSMGLEPIHALTEEQWEELAFCESSGRWHLDAGNGYYGGLQIDYETWVEHGGLRIASYPHIASRAWQIEVAERILEDQGLDAWPVCSYIAGLR